MNDKMVSKKQILLVGINTIRTELNRKKTVYYDFFSDDLGAYDESFVEPDVNVHTINMIVEFMHMTGVLTGKQKRRLENIITRNLHRLQIYGNIDMPISEYENLMQNL